MTDKEFLSWIYDRMVYKHGEDKNVDYMLRFKSIIDSLQEEPELEGIEKEVAEGTVARIDRKRIPIELKGEIKAQFKNEFNTIWQLIDGIQFANVAKHIIERVCLHFAAWGAYHLKNYVGMSKEERAKLDALEEPVNEDEAEKQFKAGDVVMYVSRHPAYSGLYLLGNPNDLSIGYSNANEPYQIALRNCTIASGDECIQFMRELNLNGYKWNESTLKIEKKEPISDDLDEEIRQQHRCFREIDMLVFEDIARHFAEWQRQKDSQLPKVWERDTIDEYAYQVAYDLSNDWAKEVPNWHDVETACKLGAEWQKQYMIKDAISCKLCWYDGFYLDYTEKELCNVVGKRHLEAGDVLKVIIIKED